MQPAIARDTLPALQLFTERDTRADEQQGAEDGLRNFPAPEETEFSPHELQRIGDAKQQLNIYMRGLREYIDRLDEEIVAKKAERETDFPSQKQALFKKKHFELETLSRTEGPASPRFKRLEQEHRESYRELESEHFKAGRVLQINLHKPIFGNWVLFTPYVMLLTLLAVLEVPINNQAVVLAFGINPPWSYLVALLIGAVFVLLAHLLGILIQRIRGDVGWRRRSLYVLAALLIGIFVSGMISLLFFMRGEVTAAIAGGQGLSLGDVGLGQGAGGEGAPAKSEPGGILWLISKMLELFGGQPIRLDDPDFYERLALFALNSMVFFLGTVFSIMRHDPNPTYERAWREYDAAVRRLERTKRRYEEKAAQIDQKYNAEVAQTEDWADKLDEQIREKMAERERLRRQCVNDMRLVLDALNKQILAYQKGNAASRTADLPAYFGRTGLLRLKDYLLT